jgi:sugar O-acyltransferase (sialic acid O-acetyltransferase NeuD family)
MNGLFVHTVGLFLWYKMRMEDVLVYGGGGHGKAVIDLLRSVGKFCPVAVLDDGIPAGTDILGVPVMGGVGALGEQYARGLRLAVNAIGGIGRVDVRLQVFSLLQEAGFQFPTLVHPSAVLEPSSTLEDGVQVLALTYISSACRIGFGSVINAGVVVSHDCSIGRVVNLSPGALLAGGVTIEDYAQVGMGATINLNLTVGSRARVGNGATVKADVPANTLVHAGSIWPKSFHSETIRYNE